MSRLISRAVAVILAVAATAHAQESPAADLVVTSSNDDLSGSEPPEPIADGLDEGER